MNKKIIITGAIPTETLHRLKQEVPSDMGIIVLDEHPIANPNYYMLDAADFIGIKESEPTEPKVKKKRKDFWNELPKPKRRKK